MSDKEQTKKPQKDKPEKKGFARRQKGIWSELKKVTWPTLPTVLKNTGTVLAVVGVFFVLLLGFDLLLRFFAYNPLRSGSIKGPSSEIITAVMGGLRPAFDNLTARLSSLF